MSDSTPTDNIVISMTSAICGDECQTGDIQWTPGPEIQAQLKRLSPEDLAVALEKAQAVVHARLSLTAGLLLVLEHGMGAFNFATRVVGEGLTDDFDDLERLFATVELVSALRGSGGPNPDGEHPRGAGLGALLGVFIGGLDRQERDDVEFGMADPAMSQSGAHGS
jgi:hypothetical protein